MNKCRTDFEKYHVDPACHILSVVEEAQENALAKIKVDEVFEQLIHGDLDKSLKIIKHILLCDEDLLETVVRELFNRAGRQYPLPGVETKVNKAIETWASVIDLEKG